MEQSRWGPPNALHFMGRADANVSRETIYCFWIEKTALFIAPPIRVVETHSTTPLIPTKAITNAMMFLPSELRD